MIISASYRTDIPAFYSKWFKNRLKAGYCKVINPYNNKPYTVELNKNKVDAFVFWTKNISPFFSNLDFLKKQKYPFIVQYTINNYPKLLDGRMISLEQSIKNVNQLCHQYGKRYTVWRYDPIVITSNTSINWHIENFAKIAKQLHGLVDEVVVSFMQFYKKAIHNILQDYNLQKLQFIDPDLKIKQNMLNSLINIANIFNINLSLCTQPDLISETIKPASCVDLDRLSDIAGFRIREKIKGNRPGCYCAENRDIGAYNSCPHGCVYCYAVNNADQAVLNAKHHNPESEFLLPYSFPL